MLNCINPTIAIIDSGIGGVSVLRQLIAKYKVGNYIYYADNLYMPYGNKSKNFITNRLDFIIKLLQTKYNVDYIIIACNTASTCIKAECYKNVFTMKFSKKHTYFGTKLTKSNKLKLKVIADCSLAKQIEKYIFNTQKLEKIVKEQVYKHKLYNIKNLVLGCTHYELVKDVFAKYCTKYEIANNSQFLIEHLDFKLNSKELNTVVLTSKKDYNLEKKIHKLTNS